MGSTMFLSVQEKMLVRIAEMDGERWDGDVEAPTGAFTTIALSYEERSLIAAATDKEESEILPYWILREDSNGFYDFAGFNSSENANLHLHALEADFYEWDSQDDSFWELH